MNLNFEFKNEMKFNFEKFNYCFQHLLKYLDRTRPFTHVRDTEYIIDFNNKSYLLATLTCANSFTLNTFLSLLCPF